MSNFQRLFKLDARRFFQEAWETQCIHGKGVFQKSLMKALNVSDVFEKLIRKGVEIDDVTVINRGQVCDPNVYVEDGKVCCRTLISLYLNGATLYLRKVASFIPELRKPLRRLEGELIPVVLQANLFLTPPESTGLYAHFDMHDSLIIQLSGRKKWRLWRAVESNLNSTELPYKHAKQLRDLAEACEPDYSINMAEGDVMYLPRGVIHAPETEESSSAHLVIWILSPLISSEKEIGLDEKNFKSKKAQEYLF